MLNMDGAELNDFTTESMYIALDYIRIHMVEGYFVSCYKEEVLQKPIYHICASKCRAERREP